MQIVYFYFLEKKFKHIVNMAISKYSWSIFFSVLGFFMYILKSKETAEIYFQILPLHQTIKLKSLKLSSPLTFENHNSPAVEIFPKVTFTREFFVGSGNHGYYASVY